MIQLTLPDGKKLPLEAPMTVLEVIKKISNSLAKAALGALVNGEVYELGQMLDKDADFTVLTFEDAEGRKIY